MVTPSPATESATQPDIGRVAATIGDPARTRTLLPLVRGRSLTTKELIYGIGAEPTMANAHLCRLKADAPITSLSSGRYEYSGLRSPAVVEMVESLLVIAPEKPAGLRRSVVPENLRAARLCYNHPVRQLGTEVSEKLLSRGWLTQLDGTHGAYGVTPEGEQALAAAGADVSTLCNSRRRFAYGCMDWSERRPYPINTLGVAMAERCIAPGRLVWQEHSRVLSMTGVG